MTSSLQHSNETAHQLETQIDELKEENVIVAEETAKMGEKLKLAEAQN